MSAGNIRMSNINMNKYDATNAMSAGTSSKLSLDHQQTASNQSSVRTGTENIHSDADSIKETGTTHIHGPDGKHYQVNGTTEMTAGGLKASGMIQEIDANGSVIKQWEGSITAAGNMSDYKNDFHTNKNGAKEDAFFASEIVTTDFKRGNTRTDRDVNDFRDVSKYGEEYINNKVHNTRNVTQEGNEYVGGDKNTIDKTTTIQKGITTEDRGTGGALKLNGDAIKQDIMGGTDRSGYLDNAYQHYKNMRNAEALHDMGKLSDDQLSFYREQYDRYMTAYSSAAASMFETQYVGNNGSLGSDTDTTSTNVSNSHTTSDALYIEISAGGSIGASGNVGINDSLSQGGGGDGPDKRVSQGKGANANVDASIRAGNRMTDTLETSTSQSQSSQQSASSQISDSRNTNNTQAVIRNQLDMTFESAYRNGQNNLDSNMALKGLNTLHNNNF